MPKGQSFLDEPLNTSSKRHLRIVITDSNENNEFLTVPLDTLRNRFQDVSCIVEPGEHPFVKVRSFINYKYAVTVNYAQLFNGISKGIFIRKEDVSADLLTRIQNGAKISANFRRELKVWFKLF